MTEVKQEQSELPKGWAETRIGDICNLINGRAFKPSEWTSNGVPIIRIQNLNDPKAEFNYCTFEVEEKYVVDNGQLLFAWSGTPGTSFGAHIWNRGKAVLNQHIFKVNINEDYFDKTFLKHLLNRNVKEYIGKAHGTAGLAHITKGKFEESQILLPSFNEQKRIANKIEELFSFLDAGVESLRKVQAQLKRYRQAVLKYAFEGKLTEEWRKTHKEQIETATKLLEKIEHKRKTIGLSPIDTFGLPKLPEGWYWARLSEMGTLDRGKSKHRPRDDKKLFGGTYPFIQTGEIRNSNGLITSFSQTYNETGLKQSKMWLVNTLCITIAANIAETALLGVPACFPDSVVGFIADEEICEIKYVHFFIKSIKNRLASYAPATAQKNINLAILRNLVAPLASLQEQHKIVEEVERMFSIADEIEKIVELSLKQSERLRQSILRKAFEGKLVPQYPNDEPAEKLLERIKAERTKNRKTEVDNQVELIHYVK